MAGKRMLSDLAAAGWAITDVRAMARQGVVRRMAGLILNLAVQILLSRQVENGKPKMNWRVSFGPLQPPTEQVD